MPDEKMWLEFFNVDLILSGLQINSEVEDLVEIGSGYGTFTIPAAKLIIGKLYAYDIEKEMIDLLCLKIKQYNIDNIIPEQRDILAKTTGLPDSSVDYVMLFNILHHELPEELLAETYRILKPKGKAGIIHWRSDIKTPRGPELSIRPTPDKILSWIDKNKYSVLKQQFTLEPYHFGMIISKL